jgi:hypothetical protein
MNIEEIKIASGLPDTSPDDHATAAGLDWKREADEGAEDFRLRVVAEARAAGADFVIFGGSPL